MNLEELALLIWKSNIDKLRNFKLVYGHCNVPTDWATDRMLAEWVDGLRKNKDILPFKLIEDLNSLGFDFAFEQDLWAVRYNELKEFMSKHGHLNIPPGDANHSELFSWAQNQRLNKNQLSAGQIDLLNQLRFSWEVKDSKEIQWDYMYEQLRFFYKKYGHAHVITGWEENPSLAKWVSRQRSNEKKLTEDKRRKLNEVRFLWRSDLSNLRRKRWRAKYEELKGFYLTHGHCNVPSVDPGYHKLRIWVDKQRGNEEELTSNQKRLLNEISFPWRKNIRRENELKWLKMYRQLKEFRDKSGHSRIPSRYKENPELAAWVARQRKNYSNLPEEKIYKLDQLQFYWSRDIRETRRNEWQEMYNQLETYFTQNGHSRVPDNYPSNPKLGRWVSTQRANENDLNPRQRELLDKLNFSWKEDIQRELNEKWEKMYAKLARFKERFGHCRVPEGWKEDINLAIWVGAQRQLEKNMPESRRQRLSELGFEWSGFKKQEFDQHWRKMFEELKAFIKEHGHAKVSQGQKEYLKLFRWVLYQRKAEKKMDPRRKRLLDEVGFLWKSDLNLENRWELKYQELKAFYLKYGHSQVRDSWKENPSLANWVAFQRKNEDNIPQEKKKKLDQLEFKWKKDLDNMSEYQWMKMYERLRTYYQENGSTSVPMTKDSSLSAWVTRQRQRRAFLSQDKIKHLEDLNFAWKEVRKKVVQDNWDKMFEKLKLLKQDTGSFEVWGKTEEEMILSAWIKRQRRKKTSLGETQTDRLNKLGFPWKETKEVAATPWDQMFEELKEFHGTHGHTQVKQNKKERNRLASWVSKQRQKADSLTEEQKNKLNSLGFLWSQDLKKMADNEWEARYHELVEFKQRFGHCNVPARWRENQKLGIWLDNLKRRQSRLSEEKRSRIEALGIKL